MLTLPGRDRLILFARTLASARHRRLSRGMLGHVEEVPTETLTPRMLTEYAEATGDPNPRYEGPGAVAPPWLLSRLVFPATRELLLHPELRLNLLRLVHAEQELVQVRPLRLGETPTVRIRVAGIEETRAGELLRIEGAAMVDGEEVAQATAGLMIRGPRRRPSERRPEEPPPAPDLSVTLATTPDQARRYAAASLDDNVIHTSELFARVAGLPRTILHGVCVLAMATGALVRERLGGDVARLRRVRARFSRPTLPGEELRLTARALPEPGTMAFEVLGPEGKARIRGGIFEFRE